MLLLLLLQIQLLAPLSDLYTDLVPVQWTITEGGPPLSFSLVWRYENGYFSPPDTTLAMQSSALLSANSFSIDPTNLSSSLSVFTSTAPTLPDGDWLVFAEYVLAGNSTTLLVSAAVSLSLSCTTLPAQVFQPLPQAYYTGPSVRVNYFLPSVPSPYQAMFTTLYNQTHSMKLYNTISRSVDFWLYLDADNSQIDWGPAVQSLSSPFSLSNGSYNLTVTYADNAGHPTTTSEALQFFVGEPPSLPPQNLTYQLVVVTNCTNQTVYVPQVVTETVYVDRVLEKNVTVYLSNCTQPAEPAPTTPAPAAAPASCTIPPFVFGGRVGRTLFWVSGVIIFVAGAMFASVLFVLVVGFGLCDKPQPHVPPHATNEFAGIMPPSNLVGNHMAFASAEHITASAIRSRSRGKTRASMHHDVYAACVVDSATPV